MNLPNRLTITRIALVPVVVILLQFPDPVWQALALAAFIAASFTDWLDGYLARKHQTVTNFGKFLDPVADKLLVLSTMIALSGLGRFPAWVCIVVLFRELAVDGLRLIAVEKGQVIPAGQLGKIKTNAQFFSILSAMLMLPAWVTLVLVILMSLLTVLSGLQYFYNGRALFEDH